jgi:hypothetical protein
MGDSSPKAQLGARQVSALRNILYELFEVRGFLLNEPTSWSYDEFEPVQQADGGKFYLEVPFDERDAFKAAARAQGLLFDFDRAKRLWWCSSYSGEVERWALHCVNKRPPTVPELARFTGLRLKAMVSGGGTHTIRLLEDHNKRVLAWQRKIKQLATGGSSADVEEIQKAVHDNAAAVIETFTDYVTSIETGRELDAVARYDSSETLRSLNDRLETLAASGIFKSRCPPFDPDVPIWVNDIAPLRDAEQRFFVWTKLQQILDDAMERGPVRGASEVREVIVIDEASKFFDVKEGNILDKISRESRKFGISLICGSQAPSHFSEDFLGNVGTKVLLGLDPMYHDQTVRKMRIDPAILDYVVAGKIAAVQISDKRDASHRFLKTRVG